MRANLVARTAEFERLQEQAAGGAKENDRLRIGLAIRGHTSRLWSAQTDPVQFTVPRTFRAPDGKTPVH